MLHCAGAGRVLIRRVLGLRHHVTIGRSIDFDQCRTRPSATLAKVDRSASSASRVLVHRCRPRSTSPDVRHRSGPSFSLRLSSSCPQEDGHGNPLRVQEDAAVAAVSLATGGCHVRPPIAHEDAVSALLRPRRIPRHMKSMSHPSSGT